MSFGRKEMTPFCHILLIVIIASLPKSNGTTIRAHKDIERTERFSDPLDGETLPTPKIVTRGVSDEEEDRNYPYEEIREYLKNHHVLKDYFDNTQMPQIGNRNGLPTSETDVERICQIKEYKTAYPKRLRNTNNVYKTIINIPDEYEQGIENKVCSSQRSCSHLESLPFGYTSYCEQEYITKALMVFNSSTVFDSFKFPSSCICKIKKID